MMTALPPAIRNAKFIKNEYHLVIDADFEGMNDCGMGGLPHHT
jgi:hypothetical protein